jgi:hypothetical protein
MIVDLMQTISPWWRRPFGLGGPDVLRGHAGTNNLRLAAPHDLTGAQSTVFGDLSQTVGGSNRSVVALGDALNRRFASGNWSAADVTADGGQDGVERHAAGRAGQLGEFGRGHGVWSRWGLLVRLRGWVAGGTIAWLRSCAPGSCCPGLLSRFPDRGAILFDLTMYGVWDH